MGAALLVDPASGMEAHEVLGRSLWFQSECGRPIRLAKRNAPVPLTRSFVVGVVARAGDSARIPLLEGEAADAEGNEDAGCVTVEACGGESTDRRVYEIALSVDAYGMSAKAVVVGEERSVEARLEPAGARSSDAEAVAARALPSAGDRESGISLGRRLWKNASRMWTGRGQAV